MYQKELVATQKLWSEESLLLMRELVPLLDPFITHEGLDDEAGDTLGLLLDAASRSTESALLLMSYGKLWDAEVILRAVFEASLKFTYLVHTQTDFKKRHDDFAEHQFQMALMKDDQKARDAIAAVEDPNSPGWAGIRGMVLPDAERDALRAKYDKAARRAMETRWGFAGLLDALVRSGDAAYATFGGLAHGYAISSHIQHADYVGVSIVLDRKLREPHRRDAAHMAHLARLISDCFTCFELRLGAAYRFAGYDTNDLVRVREKIDELRNVTQAATDAWQKAEFGTPAPAPSPLAEKPESR